MPVSPRPRTTPRRQNFMTQSTSHFLKSIGFTPPEIDTIHKRAGKSINILPGLFMRQLKRNLHIKTHKRALVRRLSADDFVRLVETFKAEVLKNPLKAAAKMSKGNILK